MRMASRLKIVASTLALSLLAGPAMADAIDGNWCHNDGRRFSIRGPAIITPGGKAMEGNYGRHDFSYVVPAPEPGTGETIFMTLMGENLVHTRRGEGATEPWVRCSPSISRLETPPAA